MRMLMIIDRYAPWIPDKLEMINHEWRWEHISSIFRDVHGFIPGKKWNLEMMANRFRELPSKVFFNFQIKSGEKITVLNPAQRLWQLHKHNWSKIPVVEDGSVYEGSRCHTWNPDVHRTFAGHCESCCETSGRWWEGTCWQRPLGSSWLRPPNMAISAINGSYKCGCKAKIS
jgi:hypothetical protein